MSRKSKRKVLFSLKILAICGAAIFMVKGVRVIYADARNDINKREETNIAKIGQESITSTQDAEVITEPVPEEKMTVSKEAEDGSEKYKNMNVSQEWNAEDKYLLAKIAMAEAEGESVEGKALVILVVLNRVRSNEFPDSISEVIFQEGQFSPVSNGRYNRVEPNKECYEALELIQLEKWDESQGALYFESVSTSDWHRNNLKFLYQYGKHYFYTDKELME